MPKILKNHTLQTIASANFFATLGVSIFNIILLTYAKSFPNPHWFVSVASIVTVVPAVFGGVTGRVADQTSKKTNWLVGTKLIQAGLYLVLAQIINQRTVFIFYTIVVINLFSDIIGNYAGNLLTIVIQDRIMGEDRQQVMGINTSVGTIMEPIGQTLGVIIISQTHNYALAGVINAVTFILSAVCLTMGYHAVLSTKKVAPQPVAEGVWQVIRKVMIKTTGMGAVSYLGIIMILNGVSVGLDAILNLLFIDLAPSLNIDYSFAILLINIVYVMGSVLGSITKDTWIDHLDLFQLLLVTLGAPVIAYSTLLLYPKLIPILVSMFVVAFMSGKLDPKMFATMMPQIDPHLTGTVFGTISTIVTVASPVGSVGIVLLYNLVDGTFACVFALILITVSFIWALWAHQKIAKLQIKD